MLGRRLAGTARCPPWGPLFPGGTSSPAAWRQASRKVGWTLRGQPRTTWCCSQHILCVRADRKAARRYRRGELRSWVGGTGCVFTEGRAHQGPRWHAASQSQAENRVLSVHALQRRVGPSQDDLQRNDPKCHVLWRSGQEDLGQWDEVPWGVLKLCGAFPLLLPGKGASSLVISPRKPSRQTWTEPSETRRMQGLAPH